MRIAFKGPLIQQCMLNNFEYAGTPLEPLIPKCDNSTDWAISRDSVIFDEAPNDYQEATLVVGGIVYSPNKYQETEGIKV